MGCAPVCGPGGCSAEGVGLGSGCGGPGGDPVVQDPLVKKETSCGTAGWRDGYALWDEAPG